MGRRRLGTSGQVRCSFIGQSHFFATSVLKHFAAFFLLFIKCVCVLDVAACDPIGEIFHLFPGHITTYRKFEKISPIISQFLMTLAVCY